MMSDDRRYSDDEVAEILDLAVTEDVTPRGGAVGTGDGLTLAELQEVAKEVGVAPARIVEAAQVMDAKRSIVPRRTSLGMPVSVGRVIELPRAVTDREWDVLVSEFRDTFAAKGKLTSHGGVRAWTNGNLHAFLEPTQAGHRLRLRTTKGGADVLNGVGIVALIAAILLITYVANTGASPVRLELMFLWLFGGGAAALGTNLLRLPGWAREREGQMEYIAGRVTALLGSAPDDAEDG
jgi:hypothetical protein